ncbi:alkaline phosphatase family protein [Pseudomonas rubra]|uniref:Caspase family protein n=1 Tax=Pseudomonas rubra TaxID=2942627 RepID=A0ABT5PA49_9PSED|nr:alkaline phosphatase family protein [Pseudomonas rubra]MDD1015178.1 caspase family protein [Pseudomonas rubra]MDD1037832.1 caspase family protein [Pseudomonas rubra]MDD1152839.1 caspase family protein [Pseudomonas rubra]
MANNWQSQIKHVVVLMMENRSFDHLLGDYKHLDPNCDGVDRKALLSNVLAPASGGQATTITQAAERPDDFSLWVPPPYLDIAPGLKREGVDLGHEYEDVVKQLTDGHSTSLADPIMGGFAQNAYEKARKDLKAHKVHALSIAQRAMSFVPFEANPAHDPLPAIQGLARHFTVCDRWFCSVPGPTWPNRFFAMLGSSHGRVLMPGEGTMLAGIKSLIAQFGKESIFSLLKANGHDARIYSDGKVPLATLVKEGLRHSSIEKFKEEVVANELPALAWIEPSYGLLYDTLGPNNSHHPSEDLRVGDHFIGEVFNSLMVNPDVWKKTLFVLLYDEHGGFYDHVIPPQTLAPDTRSADVTWTGAAPFTRLGVRVPAILASPWLQPGLVTWSDSIQNEHYDHTSLLAFLCDHFRLPRYKLGGRVEQAKHFGEAPIWRTTPELNKSFRLATTPSPTYTAIHRVETGLATSIRQVLDTSLAYFDGHNLEQAWKDSAKQVRPAPTPGERAVASPDKLEAKLRRLQDLMLNASNPSTAPTVLRGDRDTLSKTQTERLRVLCLHGVGHGDASQDEWSSEHSWQAQWRSAISSNLERNGRDIAPEDIVFLRYDDLFGDGPDFAQIARGLAMLLDETSERSEAGTRSWGVPVDQILRWTVGMTVQWLEDPVLRTQLCERLMACIKDFQPQIILAHSLGSLICYDAFRRAVAKPGAALEIIDGRVLASFGSQIAHPIVMREVWGGRVMRLHENGRGIRRWYHLYNPNDRVFTRPITSPDSARVDLTTLFEMPLREDLLDLDHSGAAYLADDTSRADLWPQLARGAVANRALEVPAFLSRSGQRKRRALIVGINEYPDPQMRLNGCINDTYLISRMLQESGYDAADIRLLHDARATRANLEERLEWLIEGTRSADERLIFYSGHGARLPASNNSREADCMDETLVLYDFNWNDTSSHFTDKLFRQFYSHLPFSPDGPGARLSVILDCCYASGMTRGNGRVRGITAPNDIRHRALQWDEESREWEERLYAQCEAHRDFTRGTDQGKHLPQRHRRTQGSAIELRPDDVRQLQRQGRLYGHHGPYLPLLLFAARENQKASEYEAGATSYGAFTYSLVEQLRKARKAQSPLSFDELITNVCMALAERSPGQTPELVGPQSVRHSICPWRVR